MILVDLQDEETWLAERQTCCTASELPALVGESSFDTPYTLNLKKRGEWPEILDREPENQEDLDWNREREHEIIRWWWEREVLTGRAKGTWLGDQLEAGRQIVPWDPGPFVVAYRDLEDDECPMSATPDCLLLELDCAPDQRMPIVGPPEQFGHTWESVVEIIVAAGEVKNVKEWGRSDWDGGPPRKHTLQCQHQMTVFDVPFNYLLSSIGGDRPVWYELAHRQEIADTIEAWWTSFWRSVKENRGVDPDMKEVTARAIKARYNNVEPTEVELTSKAEAWFDEYVEAARERLEWSKVEKDRKNKVLNQIGNNAFGRLPSGRQIRHTKTARGAHKIQEVLDE